VSAPKAGALRPDMIGKIDSKALYVVLFCPELLNECRLRNLAQGSTTWIVNSADFDKWQSPRHFVEAF
jgi:prenyltransferase beta subunit